MPRQTQAPPPGIVRQGTAEATPGMWFDCNNVRFRNGLLQPTGGNVAVPNAITPDTPRDVLTWHDNNHVHWAAIGTDTKLFAFRFDTQVLTDITPAGVPALDPPGPPVGFGLGDYGTNTYGTARDPADIGPQDVAANQGDRWSLDTFGQDLLFVPTQDGHLYHWSPATPATAPDLIASAPTMNRGVIVTDQRQVVLLAAGGDPRNIAWSDQESYTVWAPGVTNLAGSKFLQTQSYAMCACKTSAGILIFTANDLHLMSYVGPPYAYGIVMIATGCGPASARAVVAIGSTVMWPGLQTFWSWAGSVNPTPCAVGDWFYSLLNRPYVGRLFGSPNPTFSEMWWDWPDEGSQECNRYLAVNFAGMSINQLGAVVPNRTWIIGQRARSAADPTGTMDYPVLAGPLPAWQGSTAYVVNAAVVNGPNVYVCTVAGTSAATGGPAGTTSSIHTTTTAAVALGATVLPLTSVAGMAAGMPIAAAGIPAGATIASIAALNVTISAATTGTGVALGAAVTVTTTAITDGSVTWQFHVAGTGGSLYLHEYGWLDNGASRAAQGAIYAQSGAITIGEGDQRFHVTQVIPDYSGAANMLGYSFDFSEEPMDTQNSFNTGLYSVVHNGLMDVRFSGRSVAMRVEALLDGDFAIGRPRLLMGAAGRR
jgi:hypothetical protein